MKMMEPNRRQDWTQLALCLREKNCVVSAVCGISFDIQPVLKHYRRMADGSGTRSGMIGTNPRQVPSAAFELQLFAHFGSLPG